MSDWQPIDTAPRDGTRVLLWCEDGVGAVIGIWYAFKSNLLPPYWATTRGLLHGSAHDREYQPTHWQPLPPAPSEEA